METYTRGIKRSVFGEPPRAFPTLPFVRVSLRLTRDTWPRTTSELGFPLCRENTLASPVASNRKKESRRVGKSEEGRKVSKSIFWNVS